MTECADCERPFQAKRRSSTVCPGCANRRIRATLAINGDDGEDDVLWIDLAGRPVKREVSRPATWSGNTAKPAGTRRALRWWER